MFRINFLLSYSSPTYCDNILYLWLANAKDKTPVHRELIQISALCVQNLQMSNGLASGRTLQTDPHIDIVQARRVTCLKSWRQLTNCSLYWESSLLGR